jgi:hypothetical protein
MTGIDSKRIADDQPKGVNPVVQLIVGSRGGASGLGLGKVQACRLIKIEPKKFVD